MISIALPKGRLGNKVYKMLEKSGYSCPEIVSDTRKLILDSGTKNERFFLVKPSDVGIYVEYGAADLGIVGRDILLENNLDVYEMLDLKLGKCRMAVAAKNGFSEDLSRPLRVATKFPNVAKEYYAKKNRDIEVIKLYGSIELAPILNLSDVIVDIVETGNTLKENNLSVIEEIFPISARVIVNKTAFKFKKDEISALIQNLEKEVCDD